MDLVNNFLEQNSIYLVLFIVIIVWTGIFLFINSVNRRLKKLEKELEENGNYEK
ncbi:MAG: CcmD family protein [Ignavibacteria bacterium]|nr:CcmD family protein [Ignavibacteria bacterium]